ncbi:GNAT family N-acetyltransferase [Maridesulfovibrio salexigens]|uniref:GCN5-related N-acetyltransferase n=1 Tax=Maridesulfovibrio salexigens (strain ATCC 14822 / DSM 2638 / NCIMB 8403 / VKM B-1763) TaxID=526222 RepID=C6BRT4_MARSD|nr:GNAT family N-acetyltransferase [Maridesulfovibrio salexigens]ACS79524.1 GCN5-related N-acetyltransferase [Maridesulfovibrio salexigens DSM 2638]
MKSSISYGHLEPGEEAGASELIFKVFDKKVAPSFTEEGCSEFKSFATPEALRERIDQGAVILAARHDAKLVGVAEIRSLEHLCLLFVDSAEQGKGIGKVLIQMVADHCRDAGSSELTVNSSPNSRTFYESFGFIAQDSEQLKNGIRFVPMKYEFK